MLEYLGRVVQETRGWENREGTGHSWENGRERERRRANSLVDIGRVNDGIVKKIRVKQRA